MAPAHQIFRPLVAMKKCCLLPAFCGAIVLLLLAVKAFGAQIRAGQGCRQPGD